MSETNYEYLKMAIECQKLADKHDFKLTINSEEKFVQLSRNKSSEGAYVFSESIVPTYEYLKGFEAVYNSIYNSTKTSGFKMNFNKEGFVIKDEYDKVIGEFKTEEIIRCKEDAKLIDYYLKGYEKGKNNAGTK